MHKNPYELLLFIKGDETKHRCLKGHFRGLYGGRTCTVAFSNVLFVYLHIFDPDTNRFGQQHENLPDSIDASHWLSSVRQCRSLSVHKSWKPRHKTPWVWQTSSPLSHNERNTPQQRRHEPKIGGRVLTHHLCTVKQFIDCQETAKIIIIRRAAGGFTDSRIQTARGNISTNPIKSRQTLTDASWMSEIRSKLVKIESAWSRSRLHIFPKFNQWFSPGSRINSLKPFRGSRDFS